MIHFNDLFHCSHSDNLKAPSCVVVINYRLLDHIYVYIDHLSHQSLSGILATGSGAREMPQANNNKVAQ